MSRELLRTKSLFPFNSQTFRQCYLTLVVMLKPGPFSFFNSFVMAECVPLKLYVSPLLRGLFYSSLLSTRFVCLCFWHFFVCYRGLWDDVIFYAYQGRSSTFSLHLRGANLKIKKIEQLCIGYTLFLNLISHDNLVWFCALLFPYLQLFIARICCYYLKFVQEMLACVVGQRFEKLFSVSAVVVPAGYLKLIPKEDGTDR